MGRRLRPFIATLLLTTTTLLTTLALGERKNVSTIFCKTVSDCWLNDDGQAIARPKSKRGQPLPHGNCGNRLKWLRTRLSCEENVCVATVIGDKC